MAGPSIVSANNAEIKFRRDVLWDYQRKNRFSPYMGNSVNSIIYRLFELKNGGELVNIPLATTLSAAGVSTGTLVGSEEEIDNFGFRMYPDWARNAVAWQKSQIQRASFDPLSESRPALTQWGLKTQRDEIVQALLAIPTGAPQAGLLGSAGNRVNGILYSAASTGNKNTWHEDNEDRILYGDSPANFETTHAASLANITSGMTFNADLLRLMKRRAAATTGSQPAITPHMLEDPNAEMYVVFAGSKAFRDFAGSQEVKQANREARSREGESWRKNPIFRSGDIVLEGCIITEIPEIDTYHTLSEVGSGDADVSPVFLCGQAALGMPWVQNPRPTRRSEDDYGFVKGIGIEMAYGVGKIAMQVGGSTGPLKDWGVHTTFVAAAADGASGDLT